MVRASVAAVVLRKMRPSDAPPAAVLLAPSMAWSPLLVQSTFGLGHPLVSEVMTEGGQVVGVAHLVSGVPGVPDDLVMLRLAVAEACRGRGFGRMLWQRVLDRLPARTGIVSRASAGDDESPAVAAGWGFRAVNTTLLQRRELTDPESPACAPVADMMLEVRRGRLVGAVHHRVRALMAAGSVPDVPLASYLDPEASGAGDETEPTMSITAAQPGEVIAVFAVAGGADVGYTVAFVDGPGWHIADTAVLPGWRRRGVAAWVKTELTRLAVRDGAQWLSTHNDAANAPILALNRASGFRVSARSVSLRRAP